MKNKNDPGLLVRLLQPRITMGRYVLNADIIFPVIAALAGFLLYANTIPNLYALDDVNIVQNAYISEGLRGIPALLKTELSHFQNIHYGYYRPLSQISFAIEYQCFHNNPHISHLVNVLLYAATGLFLCMLLINIFNKNNPAFALAITLLFLAHPLHTEVVANIKSRDELLSFLNLIIAFYLLLKANGMVTLAQTAPKTDYRLMCLSWVFFYAALLSKETALTGLLLLPVLLFFTSRFTYRRILLTTLPFISVLVIFLYQKYIVTGHLSGADYVEMINFPYVLPAVRIPTMFTLFSWSARLVFWPYPLLCTYSFNVIPAGFWSSPLTIAGILLSLSLLFAAFYHIKNQGLLNLAALIYGITLIPAMAFVLLKGGIFAERNLYAPVMGFCIAVVWLALRIPVPVRLLFNGRGTSVPKQIFAAVPLCILFCTYSAETTVRNTQWHDNLALFSHDVLVGDSSCQIHALYGSELLKSVSIDSNGQVEQHKVNLAITQLHKAIDIWGHYSEPYHDLGWAYEHFKHQYDTAIFYYNQAIMNGPGLSITYRNLGVLYDRMGKHKLASYYINKAVETNPFDEDVVAYRDDLKRRTGLNVTDFPSDDGIDSDELYTPANKRDTSFYMFTGINYEKKGDFVNAARCLENAIKGGQTGTRTRVNLAICYGMMRDYDKAVEILTLELAARPNGIWALRTMAATNNRMGNIDRAKIFDAKADSLSRKPG